MQILKYKKINGAKITQVQLSDEDMESRLSKDELYKMWNIDGKQRV